MRRPLIRHLSEDGGGGATADGGGNAGKRQRLTAKEGSEDTPGLIAITAITCRSAISSRPPHLDLADYRGRATFAALAALAAASPEPRNATIHRRQQLEQPVYCEFESRRPITVEDNKQDVSGANPEKVKEYEAGSIQVT
jgi:hypothetical protein